LEFAMKWSGIQALLLVALAAAALAGCGTNQGTSVTPTPVLTTETFTGQLTPSGSSYYTFVAKPGQVTVTLLSMTPALAPTLKLTMTIGVYNGLYLTCTPVTGNDSTSVGTQLLGLATATTSLCIALTDPSAVIPTGSSESFTITAVHY
jgi:hypothetical protein